MIILSFIKDGYHNRKMGQGHEEAIHKIIYGQ